MLFFLIITTMIINILPYSYSYIQPLVIFRHINTLLPHSHKRMEQINWANFMTSSQKLYASHHYIIEKDIKWHLELSRVFKKTPKLCKCPITPWTILNWYYYIIYCPPGRKSVCTLLKRLNKLKNEYNFIFESILL